ncbi:MAG: hypothetical protein IJM17_09835 [Firmicutes bacterium]|nr:hypothetical protein [Bacillota bacterium]
MKLVARPIDAIVVFKGSERPLPYKFRYTDDSGEICQIMVGKIICVGEQQIAGAKSFIYDCQSLIDDVERRYQLRYSVDQCRWQLYKL